MIAIAILAGGMSMVAALFPTAIKQVESSASRTVGQVICQNGLAVAEIRLRHGYVVGGVDLGLKDFTLANFSSEDLKYPLGDPDTPFGYVVLGRFAKTAGKNDYQLVIVSYRKFDVAHTVSAEEFTCTGNASFEDKCKITVADADKDKLRIGSPLIVGATGEFARITAVDGNEAVLSRMISVGAGGRIWTVIESGGVMKSPAWATMVTRTALE